MSTDRKLLADITSDAQSRHNVQVNAAAPGTSKDESSSYFQRQYAASGAMQEAIQAHHAYLQQQQQYPPQFVEADSQHKRTSPVPSARPRRGGKPVPARDPVTLSDGTHEDVDGYPCPCMDCNQRRLNEALVEGQQQQQQQQQFNRHAQRSPTGRNQPYGRFSPVTLAPFELDSASMMPPMGAEGVMYDPLYAGRFHYCNASPHRGNVRVGYSPEYPSSPMYPGVVDVQGHAQFDIPYVPAHAIDYNRYLHGSTQDDVEGTHGNVYDSVPQLVAEQQAHVSAARSGTSPVGRKPAAKVSKASKQPAELSPPTSPTMVAPTAPKPAFDAKPAFANPTKNQTRPSKAAPSGKNGSQQTARPTSDRQSRQPRPACPFTLKLRTSIYHVITAVAPEAYAENASVILEGDRGEDLGTVISCAKVDADDARAPMVLRHATPQEVASVETLRADAAASVPSAQEAVNRLGLNMKVVGAVYQFDRVKLTFMYAADERVDFRQMLRELYSEFRCRIWMEVAPTQQ